MIDYFAIGLTHGLLALAAWRLLMRDDLDSDGAKPGARGGWAARRRQRKAEAASGPVQEQGDA